MQRSVMTVLSLGVVSIPLTVIAAIGTPRSSAPVARPSAAASAAALALPLGLSASGSSIAAADVSGVAALRAEESPDAASDSFVASFDTPADFYDRFDYQVANYCGEGYVCRPEERPDYELQKTSWPGDHDHSSTATGTCGPPTTSRTIDPDPHGDMIYWCAPGGPSTGHLMTALNHSGYAIIGFTPKQAFTDVRRVCVDVNRTDLGGGKWVNIAIVPEATFLRHPNENPRRVSDGEGPYRLDYPAPSVLDAAPFNLHDFDGVYMVRYFRGVVEAFHGTDRVLVNEDRQTAGGDKATRFQHCVTENANGTVTITQGQPGGGTAVYTHQGTLPSGPVRVIFEDDSYNPDKHGGIDAEDWETPLPEPRYTWHWDNVQIHTGYWGPPFVAYPPSVAGQFDAQWPARLLDTRAPDSTIDGLDAGGGPKAAGSVTALQVTGRGGVPADAKAVSLNVTVVDPAADGFATVYPCGDVPNASNLNFRAGDVVPNAVIADVDASGRICLWTSASTHVLVDVNGTFPSRSAFEPLVPARLYDSRAADSTIDGAGAGEGTRGGGVLTTVPVAGRGGVPGTAGAAALNVTVVDAVGEGFATVFPCGEAVPVASNLNYRPGDVVANLVVSQLGAGGAVCVYTDAPTHLVVDVAGWFPSADAFGGLRPSRLLDTRRADSTVDGVGAGGGATQDGQTVVVPVLGRGGVPAGAGAVTLNVTAVGPHADGFATVFPCGQPVPIASNLNFRGGDVVPNAVLSRIGTDGTVCVFTDKGTDLLVDVTGWFPA